MYIPDLYPDNQLYISVTMQATPVTWQSSALQQDYASLGAQAALLVKRRARRRRQRVFLVRPWLTAERRLQLGHSNRLLSELRLEDVPSFCNSLRVPL